MASFLLFLSLLTVFSSTAEQTCSVLTEKRCKPCEGGVKPYSKQEAISQVALLDGWRLSEADGCLHISRCWRVKNFSVALNFLREVGDLAQQERHHPNIHLTSYRNVTLDVFTHAICGLSENDFILAAKINQIPVELKLDNQPTAALPALSSPKIGRVHMLSGMISSGKSTYAQKLRQETHAVVFSPDDWMLSLYGADFPVERFQEHGDAVKAHIWDQAQEFLRRGIDVVLDFSLWAKAERQFWRERAESVGAEVKLYYLQCSTEIMRQRLRARNARVLSGQERHFLVAEATFEGWIGFLEPPGADEHPFVVNSCVQEATTHEARQV